MPRDRFYDDPDSIGGCVEAAWDEVMDEDPQAREALEILTKAKRILRDPDLMARVRKRAEDQRQAVAKE